MTSFIDLMGSSVWTEADIKGRLHSEIRSAISEYAEMELSRALQGMALGMHTLTPEEQANLMRFKVATDSTAALGVKARADMTLLTQALKAEPSYLRLKRPLLVLDSMPVTGNKVQVELDLAERLAAQLIVNAASIETVALLALRNVDKVTT
jgi:hypothetical protein